MSILFRTLGAAALGLLLAVPARADDLLVDASGVQSSLTTLNQAMAVARPGDRLLVLPGDYPPFQFERGVQVLGLGETPAEVRIARVDYHVSDPPIGYDSLLSNVTLGDGVTAPVPLSGNELPPGAFVLDGVIVNGGVFLGGGADGFVLLMNDTAVDPPPGFGVLGAAVHLGGSAAFRFEIVDSTISGWDAVGTQGLPAGDGLHVAGASSGTVVRSTITGGSGAAGLPAGADAVSQFGSTGGASLRLDGTTTIVGGASFGTAPGGDGVELQGTVELGVATVLGGVGDPAGSAWVGTAPVPLPAGTHLHVEPALQDAAGTTVVASGGVLEFVIEADPDDAALLLALQLDVPSGPVPFALGPTLGVFVGNDFPLAVPTAPFDLPGLMLYGQAFVRPPQGGPLLLSNTVVRRVDFLETIP